MAGRVGVLGRCVHCSQTLGVRTFRNVRVSTAFDYTYPRRTWHQQMRPVRIFILCSWRCNSEVPSLCLDARGFGKTRCQQVLEVPSWHQPIFLRSALRCLLPFRSYSLRRRLHFSETGGIPLVPILPSSSRRHYLRRFRHFHREAVASPCGDQTQSGKSWWVMGGSRHEGCRVLLGDFLVLFNVAGVEG